MSKGKASATKQVFDPKSYAKPGVSAQDVSSYKVAFDLFDSDQGGSIDIRELKAAMISLGFQTKNYAIFHMVTELDADGSGAIDFQQWLDLMTRQLADANNRQNIKKVFSLFDHEGSGFISMKNIRSVIKELGQDIPEKQLQEMMDRADTDYDGLVSEEEFYTIVTRPIKE